MLRFTIFGIPTKIHWMFWVVAALLGGIGRRGMTPDAYKEVLVWVAVIFVSILWHELGHALTARKYGSRPHILLYAFGGLAISAGGRTRKQNLHVIAAGPGFGLVLGIVALLLWKFVIPTEQVNYLVRALFVSLIWVNIFWSLINMLPVLPLDGGQFLEQWMHHRNPRLRGQIGTGVGAAVAVYAILNGQPFMAVMFGLLAYQNYKLSEGQQVKFF